MYSHASPAALATEVTRDPTFPVALGPKTWGQESITYHGQPHSVRWLQAETEFDVFNDSHRPQAVTISLEIATLRRPRYANLLVNGESMPAAPKITHEFWASGPETVQYQTTLQPGKNHMVLKSDDPMDLLPGNRAASFLLLDNVHVGRRH